MFALISPERIDLPLGTVIRMPATWQDYQRLVHQRGDGAIPRIKFRSGEVLLMSPLPIHGRNASLIADIVKVLLDAQQQDYDSFTPITMDLPEASGIEPDYCFYITHWQAVSGKDRIRWGEDPPPDLVIEVDVTSYTDVQDYLPYQVPEVWLLKKNRLAIHQLQDNRYVLQTTSQYFPSLDLPAIATESLQIAHDRNTSTAIRTLRQKLAFLSDSESSGSASNQDVDSP
jgi:Uma2 family endonuclease